MATVNNLQWLDGLGNAAALNAGHLLHVNQLGIDSQLPLRPLLTYILNVLRPVGSTIMSPRAGFNPNALFPGTTWTRWGAAYTLRVSNDDESNIGTFGGSADDGVQLAVSNLPAHTHELHTSMATVPGDHTHGAWTDTQGQHTHYTWLDTQGDHQHQDGMYAPGAQWSTVRTGSNNSSNYPLRLTTPAGAHSHNIGMDAAGAHSHNIGMDTQGNHSHELHAATTSSGSGARFNVQNRTAFISYWVRTE